MSLLDPAATSVNDICAAALKQAGIIGKGQIASAEDVNWAWAQLQMLLQQWERKRWLVYQLVSIGVTSTGATSYTVGPGGTYNTGVGSVRPAKIESAFLRQLNVSPSQPVDYPLGLIQAREDYDRIRLKSLTSFPTDVWYDPAWPLGTLYPWPIPQSALYAVYISVLAQLPSSFATTAVTFSLPYEYFYAILTNLAMRLRPYRGIGTWQGDLLPAQAKEALNVLRGANTQIARLQIPAELSRPGVYDIFGDRSY
jgi:hypothetical protein